MRGLRKYRRIYLRCWNAAGVSAGFAIWSDRRERNGKEAEHTKAGEGKKRVGLWVVSSGLFYGLFF